jgi:hypothetical protein
MEAQTVRIAQLDTVKDSRHANRSANLKQPHLKHAKPGVNRTLRQT